MKQSNIIELNETDIEKVNGGLAPAAIGIGLGAIGGAIAGAKSGGWRGALAGAVLGGASAGAGAMVLITTGFTRAGWAVKAVFLGGSSAGIGGGGPAGGESASRLHHAK